MVQTNVPPIKHPVIISTLFQDMMCSVFFEFDQIKSIIHATGSTACQMVRWIKRDGTANARPIKPFAS